MENKYKSNLGQGFIPGTIIAFMLSYAVNKSILWAILHLCCGWFYVIYWLFSYTDISAWINSWVIYS